MVVDENWVSWHTVCCTVFFFENGAVYDIQTFCERQIHWMFALFHVAFSFVFGACVHLYLVLLVDCDIANTSEYEPDSGGCI